MRRVGIIGVCLLSALGLAAIVAATATAGLPEVGRCVAREGGKYTNSNCTKTGKPGAFEFEKNAIRKGLTITDSSVLPNLEFQGALSMTCRSESGVGEYLEKGTKPATKDLHRVVLTFKGCELPLFSASCQTGATEGEVVTKKLRGAIKYIAGKGTEQPVVGQLLTPELRNTFVTFNCPAVGLEASLRGSVIVTYAKVNKMSATNTLTFEGEEGIQISQHFEGETKDHNLEQALPPNTPADLGLPATVTNEEELELKA